MGKMQRRKGAQGELEFAHLCQEYGYSAVHRTAQHCGKTGQAGDVEGLPGIHIEVKRTESLRLYDALNQSKRDCTAAGKNEIPIVAHRKNKSEWVVIMTAADFFKMYKKYMESSEDIEQKKI